MKDFVTVSLLIIGVLFYVYYTRLWRKKGKPKTLRSKYFQNMICAAGLFDNGIGLAITRYYKPIGMLWNYNVYSAMILGVGFTLRYTRTMKSKLVYLLFIFISQILQIKTWYLYFTWK